MATYHFTFGSDHLAGQGYNKYVTVEGVETGEQARGIMVALYGREWSHQYLSEPDFAGYLERWASVEHLRVTLSGPVLPPPTPETE